MTPDFPTSTVKKAVSLLTRDGAGPTDTFVSLGDEAGSPKFRHFFKGKSWFNQFNPLDFGVFHCQIQMLPEIGWSVLLHTPDPFPGRPIGIINWFRRNIFFSKNQSYQSTHADFFLLQCCTGVCGYLKNGYWYKICAYGYIYIHIYILYIYILNLSQKIGFLSEPWIP